MLPVLFAVFAAVLSATAAAILLLVRGNARAVFRRGEEGERAVAGILSALPEKFVVMNDVIVPSRTGSAQIDHVVISEYGVFVIETKNYAGILDGDASGKTWRKTLGGRAIEIRNPVMQNSSHVSALSLVLALKKELFVPLVALSPECALSERLASSLRASGVSVVPFPSVASFVASRRPRVLSRGDVGRLCGELSRVMYCSPLARRRHLRSVARSSVRGETDYGRCPECGGKVVLVRGKAGLFLGCSNFPSCRFSRKWRNGR